MLLTQFGPLLKHERLNAHAYDAIGLTWEQLKQAKSYKDAVLPSYLLTPQPVSAAAAAKPTVDPPLSQD